MFPRDLNKIKLFLLIKCILILNSKVLSQTLITNSSNTLGRFDNLNISKLNLDANLTNPKLVPNVNLTNPKLVPNVNLTNPKLVPNVNLTSSKLAPNANSTISNLYLNANLNNSGNYSFNNLGRVQTTTVKYLNQSIDGKNVMVVRNERLNFTNNKTVQYPNNSFTSSQNSNANFTGNPRAVERPIGNLTYNAGMSNRTQNISNYPFYRSLYNNVPTNRLEILKNNSGNSSIFYGNTNRILSISRNITSGRNTSAKIDPNFNPTRWLLKVQAPWKHVSDNSSPNETTIVQVCKFENKSAICSAEYSSSLFYEKLWIKVVESEGRSGIDISAYEHGHVPRVIFYNRVIGTTCQIFANGTFHQICVKVYGYDKSLGPTRVCVQLGAALFNHGVASTDFRCFRFGSLVRHEDSMDGESPNPAILNRFITSNNYSNIIDVPTRDSNSFSPSLHSTYSLFITAFALIALLIFPIIN